MNKLWERNLAAVKITILALQFGERIASMSLLKMAALTPKSATPAEQRALGSRLKKDDILARTIWTDISLKICDFSRKIHAFA